MSLSYEQFAALVQRQEEYARRHPQRYRLKVALLAWLGFGYVLFMLALALGALALSVFVFFRFAAVQGVLIGIPAAYLAFGILTALWLRHAPDEGLVVRPSQCPRLHDAIVRIRTALAAPRVQRVVLDAGLQAGAAEIPRLGFLGWRQNRLYLGFLLLHVLTADQLRAVIAHELGHLSRNHAPFAGWIYRVRLTWARLGQAFGGPQPPWWALGISWFARWYWPRFNANSFVLGRADEHVADACGVEVTDRATIGEALIGLHVMWRLADEVVAPKIGRRAEDGPEPPDDIVEDVIRMLRTELTPERAERWLEQELRVPTDYTDTHPSLSDRLAAIGYQPAPQPDRWRLRPLEETAASVFFGDRLAEWTRELGRLWKEQNAIGWRMQHEWLKATREKLARLEEKQRTAGLDEAEAWLLAKWTCQIGSEAAAIAALRELLAERPDDSGARGNLGMLLLKAEDPEGIEHVEEAMQSEPDLVFPGLEALARFARNRGRLEEAEDYRRRLRESYDALYEYHMERQALGADDTFLPHDLSPAWVKWVCQSLAAEPELQEVYLVRKSVQHFPAKPLYVLSLVAGELTAERVAEILDKIDLPASVLVVEHHSVPGILRGRIEEAAGLPIYTT